MQVMGGTTTWVGDMSNARETAKAERDRKIERWHSGKDGKARDVGGESRRGKRQLDETARRER